MHERASGRPQPPELQALVQAVVVTGRPERAAEKVRAASAPLASLSTGELLGSPYLMLGTTDGLVEKLLANRERWGFTHYTVRSDAAEAFAPVVAALG